MDGLFVLLVLFLLLVVLGLGLVLVPVPVLVPVRVRGSAPTKNDTNTPRHTMTLNHRADSFRSFSARFQLTVNVVALFICTVGAITGFGTPLKPIQLAASVGEPDHGHLRGLGPCYGAAHPRPPTAPALRVYPISARVQGALYGGSVPV
eukprot:3263707-Rhodomonas_salina.1